MRITAPIAPSWTIEGRLDSPLLPEVSGIAASRARPGVLWVHNDSGDAPRLYSIATSGRLIGAVHVRGADAVDWEDLAFGPGRGGRGEALYVADTGDNRFARPVVQVYRVPEPAAGASSVDAERIDLRYPDGEPRNVEALVVDPRSGELVLVTKTRGAAELFVATREQLDAGAVVLTAAGRVDLRGELATGAAVSRDGASVVVRTYERVHRFERRGDESLAATIRRGPGAVLEAPESEAICFDPDGASLWSVDEGLGASVHRTFGAGMR